MVCGLEASSPRTETRTHTQIHTHTHTPKPGEVEAAALAFTGCPLISGEVGRLKRSV